MATVPSGMDDSGFVNTITGGVGAVSVHIDVIPETPPPERTTAQIFTQPGLLPDAQTYDVYKRYFKDYREMRTDPTIAFVRMLCVAPLVNAGWTYKEKTGAPHGAVEFVEQMFEPLRIRLTKSAIEGYIDFGWSPYEMVKFVNVDGYNCISKFKPLLQLYTDILVDKDTGEYLGLRQDSTLKGVNGQVDLSIYDSLCLSFDTEGTDFYGVPLMENARTTWEATKKLNEAADRYDTKIAGATIVVHYPVGISPYKGNPQMDNYLIAKDILSSIRASGEVAVPQNIAKSLSDLNADLAVRGEVEVWKLEYLTADAAANAQFIERLNYFDALKARAFGFPERAILEGTKGTKAESESQAVFAMINIETRNSLLCQQVNQQAVDLVLDLNWGQSARGTVYIEPNPVQDDKIAFYRALYQELMKNPTVLAQQSTAIDFEAWRQRIGIPELSDEERAKAEAQAKQAEIQKQQAQLAIAQAQTGQNPLGDAPNPPFKGPTNAKTLPQPQSNGTPPPNPV